MTSCVGLFAPLDGTRRLNLVRELLPAEVRHVVTSVVILWSSADNGHMILVCGENGFSHSEPTLGFPSLELVNKLLVLA